MFYLKGKARTRELCPRGQKAAIGWKQRRGQRRGHSTTEQGTVYIIGQEAFKVENILKSSLNSIL